MNARAHYYISHHNARLIRFLNRETLRGIEFADSPASAERRAKFLPVPPCPCSRCCSPHGTDQLRRNAIKTARELLHAHLVHLRDIREKHGADSERVAAQRRCVERACTRLRDALAAIGYAADRGTHRLRLTDLRVATDAARRRMLNAADACVATIDRLLEHAA